MLRSSLTKTTIRPSKQFDWMTHDPPVDLRTVAVGRKFSYLLCPTSELAYELRQQGYHQWVSTRKADWDWRGGGCSWTSLVTCAARRQLGWGSTSDGLEAATAQATVLLGG
jgi:hypothetical protein